MHCSCFSIITEFLRGGKMHPSPPLDCHCQLCLQGCFLRKFQGFVENGTNVLRYFLTQAQLCFQKLLKETIWQG